MSLRSAGITPAHPLIREYVRSLSEIRAQGYEYELALRPAFQNLLADSARLHGWSFISEPTIRVSGHTIRPDGLVRDGNNFPRGYWEAKDTRDDLEREIDRKIRNDYPVQRICATGAAWRRHTLGTPQENSARSTGEEPVKLLN